MHRHTKIHKQKIAQPALRWCVIAWDLRNILTRQLWVQTWNIWRYVVKSNLYMQSRVHDHHPDKQITWDFVVGGIFVHVKVVVEVFKAEDGFFRGDGVHRELYQYVHIRLWLCLLFEKNSRKCANTQAACVYSKPPHVHQCFALRGERNWTLKRTKITQGLCR